MRSSALFSNQRGRDKDRQWRAELLRRLSFERMAAGWRRRSPPYNSRRFAEPACRGSCQLPFPGARLTPNLPANQNGEGICASSVTGSQKQSENDGADNGDHNRSKTAHSAGKKGKHDVGVAAESLGTTELAVRNVRMRTSKGAAVFNRRTDWVGALESAAPCSSCTKRLDPQNGRALGPPISSLSLLGFRFDRYCGLGDSAGVLSFSPFALVFVALELFACLVVVSPLEVSSALSVFTLEDFVFFALFVSLLGADFASSPLR
jgi:hypothetical protein